MKTLGFGRFEQSFVFYMIRDFFLLLLIVAGQRRRKLCIQF
ncbi:MAG: hypothetical protein RL631_1520 [Pseudomonadota bacterium]